MPGYFLCALVPGSFGILGRNFLLTSDAHVTSVLGGVFIVPTKGAKRGWDSRAGEGEAGVAGLGGDRLQVGSKTSVKAPALSVPQVGSRRKPRAGDGDIGPAVPSPSVSLPGIQPFLLVTLSELSLRRNYIVFGAAITSEQAVFFTLGHSTASPSISSLLSHCTRFNTESRGQKAPVCDSLLLPPLRGRSLPPTGPDTLPADHRDAIWGWHSKDPLFQELQMSPIKTSRANLSSSCYNTEENNNLLGFSDSPGLGKKTFTGRKATKKKRGRKTHRYVWVWTPFCPDHLCRTM